MRPNPACCRRPCSSADARAIWLHGHLYPGSEQLEQVDEWGYTQIPAQQAFAGARGVFCLREKLSETDEIGHYRRALGLILRFLTMPETNGLLFGQKAFAKWAQALLPLFERLLSFCGGIWQVHGGFMPPPEQLAGRPMRRQLAQILLEMGDTCAQMECILGAGV